jgi:mutual gliding-motility protein MglA
MVGRSSSGDHNPQQPMGFINVAERTINAKLVYYGVGVGGKTTSLQQVHGIFCPRNEVQLVSINTEEDSTLLFDFLPINLGSVGGFKVRIQGFTVPGQPKYKQMRKYVLQGADAVVFVVDSQRSRLEENLESLRSMREHLREQVGTSEDIPIIVQYNKRDLDDLLTEDELDEHFKFREDVVTFPSVATEGHGVFEAFVEATVALVERKVSLYGLTKDNAAPRDVAENVRTKLWEICDDARRAREIVPIHELPQTRVALADEVAKLLPADGENCGDALELLDSAPSRSVERAADLQLPPGEEEFDFGYELRESAGAARAAGGAVHGDEMLVGDVLSDEELDLDLSAGLVAYPGEPKDDSEPNLLDKTVRSNLELATRFGELDEQRLMLERKVHELVDIAQCTVHDLNRPISAVRLMLSTLNKGYFGAMNETQTQAVENGLMAVNQMERLVRDLLDSSRLDHDGVRLEFASCDLTLLVADVLRTLRYELEENSLLVRVEPLPVILADSWALTKALMNLLGNAIAYRDSERTPLVRIFCEERGDFWSLAVSDNGIGIPSADRKRLFRRFERGSNTGGISGTGLGLHIVKEIVQGHGGTVSFESEVNSGTTFWLNLPKHPVLAEHSPFTETAARADL